MNISERSVIKNITFRSQAKKLSFYCINKLNNLFECRVKVKYFLIVKQIRLQTFLEMEMIYLLLPLILNVRISVSTSRISHKDLAYYCSNGTFIMDVL